MRSWTVLLAACALLAAPAQGQKPPPLGVEPAPMGPGGKPAFGGPPPRPETLRPSPGSNAAALPGKPPPLPPGSGPFGGTDGGRRQISSGTGFVVAPGRLLTNQHVTAGCTEMRVRTAAGGTELLATIAAQDEQRDLALLTVRGEVGPPLTFRSGPDLRRGEGVVTYGFPLAGLLSSGPTLTTGEISALAGLRDNPRQFQISAPVQPGNSGGPLLDMQGNVVGVVVSKLNAQRIAQSTGDIPQNVNFAVKGAEALEFLRRNGVEPRVATTAGQRSAPEVGELAHPSTVFLRCMR
jgi:S1-C subfamily serine protease